MNRYRLDFGRSSEKISAGYLKENGYRLLELNYKNRLGEIDIIAEEGRTICFVEVKARSGEGFGLPQEAVGLRKQHKLSRCALSYLKEKRLLERSCRFDVLAVIRGSRGEDRFKLIKNAFELDENYSY